MSDENLEQSLATEIVEGLKRLDSHQANAESAINEAIIEGYLVGTNLILAKKRVANGKWLGWLKERVSDDPTFQERKVQRLMSFSRQIDEHWGGDPKAFIKEREPHSMTRAMISVGISAESKRSVDQTRAKPAQSPLLKHAYALTETYNSEIESRPVRDWSPEKRKTVKLAIKPLIDVYRELDGLDS